MDHNDGQLSFKLFVDETLGCIACKWGPTLGYRDGTDFYRTLGRMPAFRSCTRLFHDFRDTLITHGSDEILSEARRPYLRRDIDTPLRIAFLASSNLTFGRSRTLASIRDSEKARFNVFRCYAAASEWLGLPPHAGEVFDRF